MLDKQDKIWLENTMETKIKEALTVEVQMEIFDKETGIKETKKDTIYLPEFLVDYFSHIEGSLRGMQETVDHTKNRSVETKEGVKAIAEIFLGAEGNFKQLSEFLNFERQKQIEEKIKERVMNTCE